MLQFDAKIYSLFDLGRMRRPSTRPVICKICPCFSFLLLCFFYVCSTDLSGYCNVSFYFLGILSVMKLHQFAGHNPFNLKYKWPKSQKVKQQIILYYKYYRQIAIWSFLLLHYQREDLRQQWPEPGCWPAVFVKTMVCWGCPVLRVQKTWLWSLLLI